MLIPPMRSIDSILRGSDGHLTRGISIKDYLITYYNPVWGPFCTAIFKMKSAQNLRADRLKQLAVLRGGPPTHRSFVLLFCATAGCAGVDINTSVTDQALSSPNYYPVSDSQNPFGLEGEV